MEDRKAIHHRNTIGQSALADSRVASILQIDDYRGPGSFFTRAAHGFGL